jgi:CRP-like cAMP-binding protein
MDAAFIALPGFEFVKLLKIFNLKEASLTSYIMKSDALYRHFCKHISLTEQEFMVCEPLFQQRKYRKHQFILQEGQVSHYESFIIKGCTRTYEIDDKGLEHIMQFGLENWWIGDMYSFLTATPSKLNIDCIEETEVLQISKPNQDLLYQQLPKMERYFRILVQNAFIAAMNRIYSNLSKPALERYQEFIQKYPQIEQRVPNHQIASFLGITPQSLSRIRSQYAVK